MNILMISEVFPNNVDKTFGTFTYERAIRFKKKSEIFVISTVPFFPKNEKFKFLKKWHNYSKIKRSEIINNIEVYRPRRIVIPFIGNFTSGIFYKLTILNELKKLINNYKIDIIDSHFLWPDGYAAVEAGKRYNIPVSVTAHGTDLNLMIKYPTIKQFIIKTANESNIIIAVSNALAKIIKKYKINSKVKVINNGVDTSKFYNINKIDIRKKLGLKSSDKIIISIGQLIDRKRFDLLIESFRLLLNKYKNSKLLIIGKGPKKNSLEAIIKNYNLVNKVQLLGSKPHDELFKWINAADIFCLTSSREGWPTVFFESWSCGVPVVATAVQGAPEAICSEDYGYLIHDTKPYSICSLIEKGLEKNWNENKMIKYAEENSWDNIVNRIFDEFKKIIT